MFAGSGAVTAAVPTGAGQVVEPEPIAGRLGVDFPEDETTRISHEAIDQARDVQGRGGLGRELSAWLGTGRALGVPRARTPGPGKPFLTRRSCSASGRPRSPTGRFPGTGQVTFILGLGSSAIGTLVERSTRLAMLLGLPGMDGHGDQARVHNGPALAGHGAQAVRDAIATTGRDAARAAAPLVDLGPGRRDGPAHPAAHRHRPAGVLLRSAQPWQRGTNENPNGLLRQDFPKGTDLSKHSPDDLAAVAAALTSRPRKTLNWQPPAEALNQLLSNPSTASGVATTS
jgi:IS30 family transposase